MGASNRDLIFLVLDAILGLVYLVVLFLALRRQKGWTSPAFWLAGYALLGLALHASLVAGRLNWLPWMDFVNRLRIDQSAAVLLALFLFLGLRSSLGTARLGVLLLGGLGLAAVALALQNYTLIFLTWLSFSIVTLGYAFYSLGQTRQHLHRSRIFFWLPVLALAIANELMLFYQVGRIEVDYLRACAVVMMAYTVLSHHLPDTRDFTRLALIYILSTLLIVVIYIGGFWLADTLLRNTPGYQTIFTGAGVAVVISLLFTPIFSLIRAIVNRLFKLETYDPSQTLREYALSTSNILELDKLAEVAVGLIMEALDIRKGMLFLVDPEIGEEGKKVFRLREVGEQAPPASDLGEETKENPLATPTGRRRKSQAATLAEHSPIVRYLREQHQPLLQYDLDFAPDFLDAPLLERKWFSEVGLDVYVPITSKGEWLGLLALGPKPARRYTNEDLNLLSAIASQTGVALENARLVENLKKLNAQVRDAYAFLDKANHDLAKLEMTKSNFISIASHELRTPLTSIKGYTEMLLETPTLGEDVLPFVKGIHKGTVRLHEIMDSMFDVAQMDSRAIELQRQDVFVTELVRSVFQELSKFASERDQELTLDLPQLPSIKADPNSMRKLFYHLVINAIKFTPNKGKVTITGRHVPPNNRDLPEGGVEIVVADTGVGVDKNYQEVIFTKFYQPGELLNRHSTGKTKFKGSGVGLGLALSRGIAEAHGGKIWVDSPGYDEETCPGSEFHVVLPIRSQGESKTVRMGSAVKLKL
jgi:signal transduction histidine kinase